MLSIVFLVLFLAYTAGLPIVLWRKFADLDEISVRSKFESAYSDFSVKHSGKAILVLIAFELLRRVSFAIILTVASSHLHIQVLVIAYSTLVLIGLMHSDRIAYNSKQKRRLKAFNELTLLAVLALLIC